MTDEQKAKAGKEVPPPDEAVVLPGVQSSQAPVSPNPDYDPQVHLERVQKWQASNSDERFRVNYDCLNQDSIVLDLGGFKGDFAFYMNRKYGATCHVFEVVPDLCEKMKADSRFNEKIIVHSFGLAGSTRKEKLYLANEGSSIFYNRSLKDEQITVELIKASDWFEKELAGRMVDLMKINIEGGEYELLEHMLEERLTSRIRNIQVQFHEDVIPNAAKRMEAIHSKLANSHRITFQEKFVWENWELIV